MATVVGRWRLQFSLTHALVGVAFAALLLGVAFANRRYYEDELDRYRLVLTAERERGMRIVKEAYQSTAAARVQMFERAKASGLQKLQESVAALQDKVERLQKENRALRERL